MIKHIFKDLCKVAPDLLMSALLLLFYFSGTYVEFSPTIQTIALKATLVSLGFVHSHIIQTIAFPNVNWGSHNEDQLEKVKSIVIYFVFIWAYSQGG